MPQEHRLPPFVEPQLATLADAVPTAAGWIYELKFDGYRTLVRADGKAVRCFTRTGLDWTDRYGAVPKAIAALRLRGTLLDGEMVVIDPEGHTSFAALQEALKQGGAGIAFCAFDLLFHDGKDLRALPLVERKTRLERLLARPDPSLIYSAHLEGRGDELLRSLCRRKFEGLIAKRGDRPYRSGRGTEWLKVKCSQEQEFVVAGFTRSDAKLPFASLVLAVHENGGLRYAGHVGTGFNTAERRRLRRLFEPLERPTTPLAGVVPADVRRRATWLEPQLLVQVAFTEFTPDGMARHPSYRGIREDKPPADVRREMPVKVSAARVTSAIAKRRIEPKHGRSKRS